MQRLTEAIFSVRPCLTLDLALTQLLCNMEIWLPLNVFIKSFSTNCLCLLFPVFHKIDYMLQE